MDAETKLPSYSQCRSVPEWSRKWQQLGTGEGKFTKDSYCAGLGSKRRCQKALLLVNLVKSLLEHYDTAKSGSLHSSAILKLPLPCS